MSKNTLLILKWNYQVWNLVKILPLLQLSHLKKYDCDETRRNVKYLLHSIVMHFWANLQALIYREGGGATQVGGDKEWEGTKRTWQPRKMGPASSLYKKNSNFWCTLSGFYICATVIISYFWKSITFTISNQTSTASQKEPFLVHFIWLKQTKVIFAFF